MTEPTLPPLLDLQALAATEAAAIASAREVGRGDKVKADQVAVDAMRTALNQGHFAGTIVIGEGERDEAPMLYIGEQVGQGGTPVDIALDPLEGTTLTAKGQPGALCVLAMAAKGGLLHAPDVYMQKIAVGPDVPTGTVDISLPITDNLHAVARAKGCQVEDLAVCVLERERHADLIAEIRAAGARLLLIGDGDVAGAMATALPESPVDVYVGSGGAPEGVLAAVAVRCLGGDFQGRLLFRDDAERGRAARLGITDLDRVYGLTDLASGPVLFCATGVTSGALLEGVEPGEAGVVTHSLVMNTQAGTIRHVMTEHTVD